MNRRVHPVFFVAAIVVYIFLLFPLIVIMLSSFDPSEYMGFPPKGFSLKWYAHIWEVDMFVTGLKVSTLLALGSTLVALLLGVPAAYVISRFSFTGRDALNSLVMSPLLVPQLVVGLAFLQYLVVRSGMSISLGLLLSHTIILIPYAIRVVGASLQNLPISIEEAALSLGSTGFTTFWRVVLPNIRTGILAAVMLAFITSFNNVPMSLFLSGPGVTTLPIQMMIYSEYYFDPTIAAVSVFLLVLTMFLVFLMERTIGLTYFSSGGVR